MSLSDVISSLGLSIYPIIALTLFLFVFTGVIIKVLRARERADLDHGAMLPLADEQAAGAAGTHAAKERRP